MARFQAKIAIAGRNCAKLGQSQGSEPEFGPFNSRMRSGQTVPRCAGRLAFNCAQMHHSICLHGTELPCGNLRLRNSGSGPTVLLSEPTCRLIPPRPTRVSWAQSHSLRALALGNSTLAPQTQSLTSGASALSHSTLAPWTLSLDSIPTFGALAHGNCTPAPQN